MNLLAPVNRDPLGRPFDLSARTQDNVGDQTGSLPLDPASLLGLFAHIHALGLAQLASRGNSEPADASRSDQRWSAPQVPPQALPGGLLASLAAAPSSGVSPLLANAAAGRADTAETVDPSEVEDRSRQRRVSGIADQVNGRVSNREPPRFARGITNCDNAYSYCMARLPDLRSRGKCDRLKILCDSGIDGIFGPGVAGSNRAG